jgi:hypothetical protein
MILAFSLLTAGIHDHAGEYGYDFLNVPSGPVSIALAGRGAHSMNNPAAFIMHPAAACEYDQRVLGVSHSPWLEDTQANTLAYSYAKRVSHFGIALRNLDYGELETRDDYGNLIGHFNPLDMDLMANYAYRISPSLYFGFNFGALYQKLDTATSLGLHSDFGFSLIPPVAGSKLSASIRNIGNATKTNDVSTRFPTTIEADISKEIKFSIGEVMIGASGTKVIDEEMKGTLYSEVSLYKVLKIRGGYKLNYSAQNLSAGLGLTVRRISVDYGFAAFSDGLNDVHSIGLSYQF